MTENNPKVFTLSDGTEVSFDFSELTRREFNAMFDPAQTLKDGDATITKITGLTAEQLDNMLKWDSVRLIREIILRANRPDPI